jgi:hypothetical protein
MASRWRHHAVGHAFEAGEGAETREWDSLEAGRCRIHTGDGHASRLLVPLVAFESTRNSGPAAPATIEVRRPHHARMTEETPMTSPSAFSAFT